MTTNSEDLFAFYENLSMTEYVFEFLSFRATLNHRKALVHWSILMREAVILLHTKQMKIRVQITIIFIVKLKLLPILNNAHKVVLIRLNIITTKLII